jgi:beta-glucanase (GH16 family)
MLWTVIALSCPVTGLFAAEPNQEIKPYSGGSEKYVKLVWADEFDGKGLPDPAKWSYEKGYVRNREMQYYAVERLENTEVRDGNLVITVRKDNAVIDGKEREVTSGSIETKKKGDWLYGRFEARIKFPSCLGTWPAFWMMPTNPKYGGWPNSGEIDILEHVGFEPDKLHFNLHTGKYNHMKKTGRGTSIHYENPMADYHIYAVEWFPDRIDWFFDDKKVLTVKNDGSGTDAWPLDQPFHLKLNLAFGGSWGAEKGVDLKPLPMEMQVDYVRVFQ